MARAFEALDCYFAVIEKKHDVGTAMMAATKFDNSIDTATNGIRWWPLLLFGIFAGLLMFAVQGRGWAITRPAQDIVYLWGAINVVFYVWVRALSRLVRRTQIRVIVGFVLIQCLTGIALRRDGYAGDGRMIFKWRWTPTAEQQWPQPAAARVEPKVVQEAPNATADDSPAFRGANRSGVLSRPNFDWDWNVKPPRMVWRRPVGQGWSSFAVVGNYCVTQEQRESKEAIVCYDLRSGLEIWEHTSANRFEEVTSGAGPRATPTIEQGQLFALGPSGRLTCLALVTGELHWSTLLVQNAPPSVFGCCSSPLAYQGLIYVSLGGHSGALVAVDRETGTVRWRVGSRPPGYSSPHLLSVPQLDQDQVLVFDGNGLHGHAPEHGDTLWSFPWGDQSEDHVNVGQPVVLIDRGIPSRIVSPFAAEIGLLISSGYGRGTALLSLDHKPDGAWSVHEVWRSRALKSKFSSVVYHDNYLYGLDEGILTCIALHDGRRQWKRGRYGYGQLLLVDDRLVIQAESGGIYVVEATPEEHRELAFLDALNDRTWNHPVVTGNYLLVRNDREAICFKLPTTSTTTSTSVQVRTR